jgi:hypothetical protein
MTANRTRVYYSTYNKARSMSPCTGHRVETVVLYLKVETQFRYLCMGDILLLNLSQNKQRYGST